MTFLIFFVEVKQVEGKEAKEEGGEFNDKQDKLVRVHADINVALALLLAYESYPFHIYASNFNQPWPGPSCMCE